MALDVGQLMFCLLIQGAGPIDQRYRGIEPLHWVVLELAVPHAHFFQETESWNHQWGQDRGIPWTRT